MAATASLSLKLTGKIRHWTPKWLWCLITKVCGSFGFFRQSWRPQTEDKDRNWKLYLSIQMRTWVDDKKAVKAGGSSPADLAEALALALIISIGKEKEQDPESTGCGPVIRLRCDWELWTPKPLLSSPSVINRGAVFLNHFTWVSCLPSWCEFVSRRIPNSLHFG